MKVFDLHIGLSDSAIQLKKDPSVLGSPNTEFPNQFDFIRAKKGGLDIFCGMICPISIEGEDIVLPEDQISELNKHIDFFCIQEKMGNFSIIKTSQDMKNKGLKVILGLEGAYFLKSEKDLKILEKLIKQGLKIIGPKWNFENAIFADNKTTSLGRKFLKVCEENNIIIDLAHSESDYIALLLKEFKGAIIDSHTCLFELNPVKRNIKDEFVSEIIKRNGLIGINFLGEFIGGNSIEDVVAQIQTFVKKFGVDNLSIGSDFDGMELSDLIVDLEDVSKYRNLSRALKAKGFNEKDLNKIFFSNAFNFFSRNYSI